MRKRMMAVLVGAVMVATLLVALLASVLRTGSAPVRLRNLHPKTPPRSVVVSGYQGDAMEPFVSRDGRYLLFNNLNQPPVNTDIFYAERQDDF